MAALRAAETALTAAGLSNYSSSADRLAETLQVSEDADLQAPIHDPGLRGGEEVSVESGCEDSNKA